MIEIQENIDSKSKNILIQIKQNNDIKLKKIMKLKFR